MAICTSRRVVAGMRFDTKLLHVYVHFHGPVVKQLLMELVQWYKLASAQTRFLRTQDQRFRAAVSLPFCRYSVPICTNGGGRDPPVGPNTHLRAGRLSGP